MSNDGVGNGDGCSEGGVARVGGLSVGDCGGDDLRSDDLRCDDLLCNDGLLGGDRGGVLNLSFDWVVFDTFLVAVNWDVLGVLVLVHLGNVLGLVLDGVVIGVVSLVGDLDSLSDLFVFHV